MDNRPIGIFDSGLGGLTVVKEVKKILANEDIVYLGDTARVPYGSRSREKIIEFSLEDANFLLQKSVKCIVIACHTSSAIASKAVRRKFHLPVFEVITPAAKEAVMKTKNNRVGVIGTTATIKSLAYEKVLYKLNPKIKVYQKACPLFVSFVEEGISKGKLIAGVAEYYLEYFKKKKIDTLILGCTHYPLIEKEIKNFLGNEIYLLNPAFSLVGTLRNFLTKENMLKPKTKSTKDSYFVTDITQSFTKISKMFLDKDIKAKLVKADIILK